MSANLSKKHAHPWQRLSRRPVAVLLARTAVLFLLCLTLLLIGVGWRSYSERFDEAQKTTRETTRLVANQTARMIEAADLMVLYLVDIAKTTEWTSRAEFESARQRVDALIEVLPYVTNVSIVDADGKVLLTTLDSDAAKQAAKQNVHDREYFAIHRDHEHGGLHITSLLNEWHEGGEYFALTRRVTADDGAFAGIVKVSLNPNTLGDFYRALNLQFDSSFQLIHLDTTVLIREPAYSSAERLVSPLRETILESTYGTVDYVGLDGIERIGAYRNVDGYPLYVSVGLSKRDVASIWVRENWPYFVFALLALGALTLLTLVAVRRARNEDRYRDELVEAKANLEERVKERTASLETALAQKDVLFRELNHRVKNNLQVVSSLLRLHATRSTNARSADGIQSCLSRIQAMGAVHELLYRKDALKHLDFGDYLKLLCARLAEASAEQDRVRLTVEAEAVEIDINKAVPLALFVNELISNAFNHAFPGGRNGTIVVRLRRHGPRYTLTISDDGVGFDASKARPGSLGLTLARGWASQVDGTLRQSQSAAGTTFVLEFPEALGSESEAAA